MEEIKNRAAKKTGFTYGQPVMEGNMKQTGPGRSGIRNVTVVGGILTLEPQYRVILEDNKLFPRIYNRDSAGLLGRIITADLIILFTGTVSHKMAEKVRKAAELRRIPLVTIRRSSVSALRRFLCRPSTTQ